MKFPYRTKFDGVYYEAGVEVPIPASNSVEPKNDTVSAVEPKNNADTKLTKKSKK